MPKLIESTICSDEANADGDVHEAVRRRIEECPYRFVFRHVTWQHKQGRLTLRGCVPSFYLKQVLQETLRDIGNVKQIDNHLDVVSATGLSSEPSLSTP